VLLINTIVIIFYGCLPSKQENTLQGNGNVITIEYELNAVDFNSIILNNNLNINVHHNINIYHTDIFNVKVTTDSNIQDFIAIYEEKNNLIIANSYFLVKFGYSDINATELIIDVFMPKVKRIELNGVGNIEIHDGKYSQFEVILAGIGNIYLQNYEAENVNIVLSGSGNIKTWVTNSLSGIISGSGNILHKGNPSIININITGNGNVNEL